MSCRTRRGCAATKIASRPADRVTSRRPAECRGASARALLPLLLLAGCLSLEEENKLVTHQVNSKAYYEVGEFVRAEDQCRRGLAIDDDNANLKLMLGYALLRQADRVKLEEAARLFEAEAGTFGADDWRVDLGYGMTLQQLARLCAEDKAPGQAERVAELRADARAALERAGAASAAKNNTPAEVPFQLALLDLEEGRVDDFASHAEDALNKLETQDKVFAAQLSQQMGETEKQRTERDRSVNGARGRRLSRELARHAWEQKDYATAAQSMERLERFGALDRADYFTRARVREELGDDEKAVADYSKFIELSPDAVDDTVGRAVNSLTRLRARLAEKRTATPPGGP